MSAAARWFLAALLIGSAACDRAATRSASVRPGRTWTTPPLPPMDGGVIAARLPRTVHRGGPFLRNPEVTTVTFAGDEAGQVARLERFGDLITASAWWHEVVDSHCLRDDKGSDCIGDGRAGQHVRVQRSLPAELRDTDLERLLRDEARGGPLSRLGADPLVLVYLPSGVTLRDASHAQYCTGGARAYHRMLRLEGASFAYAVIPRCGDDAELTATASHEILEATTNPNPQTHGFALEPAWKNGAFTAAGTEPVDPCGLLTMDGHRTVESGFTVQRAWSNRAAQGGHDPCVPHPPSSSPAPPPYLALAARSLTVRLPSVGDTTTVLLDAASDRPVEGWTASAIDLTGQQEGDRYVQVELDRTAVKAGDAVTLTLRLIKPPPRRTSVVGVISTLGAQSYLWPIAVSMR